MPVLTRNTKKNNNIETNRNQAVETDVVSIPKNTEKQKRIFEFNNFETKDQIIEYTTPLEDRKGAITTAPRPSRSKLLEIVSLFDKSEIQYTHYPRYGDGGVIMEPVEDSNTEMIHGIAEKLFREEQGLDHNIAIYISKKLSNSYPGEDTKARVCTVIGKSVYVFDWILAQDSESSRKQYILTWIPVNTQTRYFDKHSRQWLERKHWLQYTHEEKQIFRMNQVSFQISHLWIVLKRKKIGINNNNMCYKIMKDSFLILLPTVIRRTSPAINTQPSDVAVRLKCDITNNEDEVITRLATSKDLKISRYDSCQIKTTAFQRIIGKKYDGQKREREEEMRMDTNIINKEVREAIYECHSYMIKTMLSEDVLRVIETVFKTMSETLEAKQDLVDLLETVSKATKTYHILGFLSNAQMWFRYGYDKQHSGPRPKDARTHWIPLSYKYSLISNPSKTPMLMDTNKESAEELCIDITGHKSVNINPRYIAIGLRTRSGYRIINGQIIDIYTFNNSKNDDILEEANVEEEQNKKGCYKNCLKFRHIYQNLKIQQNWKEIQAPMKLLTT